MAEEEIDLSSFDDIPDRVARAKAKAEAMRKARRQAAGEGGESAASGKSAEAPQATEAEAPEAQEAAGGEAEVDLSALDEIPDRVARAKAKAEAMRKARGTGEGAAAPAKKASAKKAPAKKAAGAGERAAAARALAATAVEREVVLQRTPAPPTIRPGSPRAQPLMEGGITTRRGFFSWLGLAWVSFATATAAGLAATGRFLFPNVLFEPPQSFKIGIPDEYDLGVDERWKDKFSVWVVKTTDEMFALISVCTHLGCTPNWLSNEQKFKCPCHGSGFYSSGINFEGPAPRPLERASIVLADDGQILIDKNTKFQYEKGQWDLAEASLKI